MLITGFYEPECPSEECGACIGSACWLCGDGLHMDSASTT